MNSINKNKTGWKEFFRNLAKCLKHALWISVLFYAAMYYTTPNFAEDVASQDFVLVDRILSGDADPKMIEEPKVRDAVSELRNNVYDGTNDNKEFAALESECAEICSDVLRPFQYCSNGRCVIMGEQPRRECSKPASCTPEKQSTIDHIRNLREAGWLTRDNFPKYMEKYNDRVYTIWQKTKFFALAIFMVFISLLLSSSYIKKIMLHWNIKKVRNFKEKFEHIKTGGQYRTRALQEPLSVKSINSALEHNLIPEKEDIKQARKVVQILEKHTDEELEIQEIEENQRGYFVR